jgi:simple sugar transport system permease protein
VKHASTLSGLGQRPDIGAIFGAVAIFIIFSTIDFEGFWSFFTLANIAQYTAILGLVAIGEGLVILVGEIDVSVGSIYGLTAIAFITFANPLGVPLAFLLAMAIAITAGLINALLVVRAGMVSLIATLSALFFYRGVIYVWTGGTANALSKANRVEWLTSLLGGNWFGLVNGFFLFLIIIAAVQLMLSASRTGNHLLAVGGDQASALSRGVEVGRTKTFAFAMSAALAGFSGIVTVCNQPQTHVTLGEQMELEAIAAAVVGGALLTGGRGSAIGSALGAFIITAVRYELIGMGAPSSWYITFVGIVLIVAIIVNQWVSATLRTL